MSEAHLSEDQRVTMSIIKPKRDGDGTVVLSRDIDTDRFADALEALAADIREDNVYIGNVNEEIASSASELLCFMLNMEFSINGDAKILEYYNGQR